MQIFTHSCFTRQYKKQPGVLINHYLAESEHQLEGQRLQVELSPGALSVPR